MIYSEAGARVGFIASDVQCADPSPCPPLSWRDGWAADTSRDEQYYTQCYQLITSPRVIRRSSSGLILTDTHLPFSSDLFLKSICHWVFSTLTFLDWVLGFYFMVVGVRHLPAVCLPLQMASAGFVHCPSENEPDVACCFFCLIELEGWEPDDDPWWEKARQLTQTRTFT